MLKRLVLGFIAGWLIAGIAFTQMGITTAGIATTGGTTTNTGTSTTGGGFASLSPVNQKIARALFNAQQTPPTTAVRMGWSTLTSGTAADVTGWTLLSLDQIAQMKQSGQEWGNVFREMKAQGLVEARNLASVVSGKN
jgi:hypothetical protein